MKKLLLPFIVCVTLFSCKKQSDVVDVQTSSTIEYKINGNQIKLTNTPESTSPISLVSGVHYNAPGAVVGYSFAAVYSVSSSINEKSKSVNIVIGIDSMITGKTYSLPSANMNASFMDSNFIYLADKDSDSTSFSITITGHKNGLISGVFSGKFEKSDFNGQYGITYITEGKFTDVKMVY